MEPRTDFVLTAHATILEQIRIIPNFTCHMINLIFCDVGSSAGHKEFWVGLKLLKSDFLLQLFSLLAFLLLLNDFLASIVRSTCVHTFYFGKVVIWLIILFQHVTPITAKIHRRLNLLFWKLGDGNTVLVIFHDTGLKFNCDLSFGGEKMGSGPGQLIYIVNTEIFYILFKVGMTGVRILDPFYLQIERGFDII